jgi:hypothetical protein
VQIKQHGAVAQLFMGKEQNRHTSHWRGRTTWCNVHSVPQRQAFVQSPDGARPDGYMEKGTGPLAARRMSSATYSPTYARLAPEERAR